MSAAPARRRGMAALKLLAMPLAVAGGIGWWYVRAELPYRNRAEFVAPLVGDSWMIRHDAKGSGYFGAPRSGERHHGGVDLLATIGDPVYAIRSGRVREARFHRGFGYFVEVDHGQGLTSLYAHLSRMDVRAGERVRQGQLIGAVGKSGNARSKLVAAHLHFEVRRQGRPFDPGSITYFHSRIIDDTAHEQNPS